MTSPDHELGISDSALLQIEADAFDREARSPDIAEIEVERLQGRAQQARINALFAEVRSGSTFGRPGLELPYPENGEDLESYRSHMKLLADKFDEEEGDKS